MPVCHACHGHTILYCNVCGVTVNTPPKLTREQRASMAAQIADAMRKHYEEHGETGDFDDAERHYRDDADDAELRSDFAEWVK
jgi:hypothetical protein